MYVLIHIFYLYLIDINIYAGKVYTFSLVLYADFVGSKEKLHFPSSRGVSCCSTSCSRNWWWWWWWWGYGSGFWFGLWHVSLSCFCSLKLAAVHGTTTQQFFLFSGPLMDSTFVSSHSSHPLSNCLTT